MAYFEKTQNKFIYDEDLNGIHCLVGISISNYAIIDLNQKEMIVFLNKNKTHKETDFKKLCFNLLKSFQEGQWKQVLNNNSYILSFNIKYKINHEQGDS